MRNNLSKPELEGLHSVMRRAAERAERRKIEFPNLPEVIAEAEELARAVADLDDELAHR